MYSGTVSLEYHADVTIPFFCFPVFPFSRSPIAIRDDPATVSIPLSQSGIVSRSSAHFLALRTVPLVSFFFFF